MSDKRIAFVSAPGSSAFMEEILDAVADAVEIRGAEVLRHRGTIADVAGQDVVCVVVPHEYLAVDDAPEPRLLKATISFGVEHPGTATFDASIRRARDFGATFETSAESVAALAGAGIEAHHFALGYSPRWDTWGGRPKDRTIDVAYLGTADPDRLGVLARLGEAMTGLRTELLIPPHEPMTRARPDFVMGEEKWRLLSDARMLINLHREGKTALEHVRVLEAICNGCVVLTESSTDLGSLVPGEHLLVSSRHRLAEVMLAAFAAPDLLQGIASNAYRHVKENLSMARSADALIAVANNVGRTGPSGARILDERRIQKPRTTPMAQWVPVDRQLPRPGGGDPDLAAMV